MAYRYLERAVEAQEVLKNYTAACPVINPDPYHTIIYAVVIGMAIGAGLIITLMIIRNELELLDEQPDR